MVLVFGRKLATYFIVLVFGRKLATFFNIHDIYALLQF